MELSTAGSAPQNFQCSSVCDTQATARHGLEAGQGGSSVKAKLCVDPFPRFETAQTLPSPAQTDPESEAPPERGGAACVAIGANRLLLFGGANRASTAFNDWWLLEVDHGDSGHWTKISPVVKLSKRWVSCACRWEAVRREPQTVSLRAVAVRAMLPCHGV